MTNKQQPPVDEKEAEAKPEGAESAEELTEEQLEHVAGGALNAYLKLGTVPGDSTYKEQLELESFSMGATLPTSPTTTIKR